MALANIQGIRFIGGELTSNVEETTLQYRVIVNSEADVATSVNLNVDSSIDPSRSNEVPVQKTGSYTDLHTFIYGGVSVNLNSADPFGSTSLSVATIEWGANQSTDVLVITPPNANDDHYWFALSGDALPSLSSQSAVTSFLSGLQVNSFSGANTNFAFSGIPGVVLDSDETFIGTNAANLFSGGSGRDTIEGRGGVDVLLGGDGKDTISGGDGDDRIYGDKGADELNGDAGDDRIWGGDKSDQISGGSGNDDLRGELGDDVINGGDGRDQLSGGAGSDTMTGDGGDDTLDGGGKRDYLYGGGKDDEVNGEAGYDRLFGGGGNDVLYGGTENDRMTGGSGSDTFIFSIGDGLDRVRDFEVGIDTLQLNDNLYGGVSKTAQQVINEFGTTIDGNAALVFRDGEGLVFNGLTSAQDLVGDIDFV